MNGIAALAFVRRCRACRSLCFGVFVGGEGLERGIATGTGIASVVVEESEIVGC